MMVLLFALAGEYLVGPYLETRSRVGTAGAMTAGLGTDLGTKLCGTGSKQCDRARQLGCLTAVELRFWNPADLGKLLARSS